MDEKNLEEIKNKYGDVVKNLEATQKLYSVCRIIYFVMFVMTIYKVIQLQPFVALILSLILMINSRYIYIKMTRGTMVLLVPFFNFINIVYFMSMVAIALLTIWCIVIMCIGQASTIINLQNFGLLLVVVFLGYAEKEINKHE